MFRRCLVATACCVALAVSSCGGDDDPGNGASAESGSCADFTSDPICLEYTGSGWGSDASAHCTLMGGDYSTSDCSSTDLVGQCTFDAGTDNAYAYNYYAPLTTDEGEAACAMLHGVWDPA